MGISCALLSERFSNLDPAGVVIRSSFEALALVGSGLFISAVLRNRRLRLASQERLRVLVETSPAAIVTVDEHGFIEIANHAAAELMVPSGRASDRTTDRSIPAGTTSRVTL
jgi:two-component system, LuxR family, sensor kinase FixL